MTLYEADRGRWGGFRSAEEHERHLVDEGTAPR